MRIGSSKYVEHATVEQTSWFASLTIGMLEYWNNGVMGFGKMERWVIKKIHN